MPDVLAVPRTPDEITSQWLSAVLGTQVRAATVTPIGTGQTGATYRVTVTYAQRTALPETFAIKLPAQDDAVRERVALGYRSEVEFYTDVADKVAIPVPGCFHSDITDDGTDFVLVLADMAPAVQGDQIAGCTEQEAGLAVEALAGSGVLLAVAGIVATTGPVIDDEVGAAGGR